MPWAALRDPATTLTLDFHACAGSGCPGQVSALLAEVPELERRAATCEAELGEARSASGWRALSAVAPSASKVRACNDQHAVLGQESMNAISQGPAERS